MTTFDAAALEQAARDHGMVVPSIVLEQVAAAVRSDQHIVLTGSPGTGKTTLANIAAEVGRAALLCTGVRLATASADWTTDDTVGAYRQSDEGMIFFSGLVLGAIEAGEWIVIDELNRAPADRALGELFTVLSGQAVTLPFKRPGSPRHISIVPAGCDVPDLTDPVIVPPSWRVVATMNTADRDLLHQLSSALLRRFCVIEVPSPTNEELAGLLATRGGAAVAALLPLRQVKDLGPAVWLSAAQFADAMLDGGSTASAAAHAAFGAYILPQLDDLSADAVAIVRALLGTVLDEPELEAADRTLVALAPVA
jgi:MoxR-like ATPase